jgi:4-amino-4-deoxy-L-arabinose transferase-like glycosyltransferase
MPSSAQQQLTPASKTSLQPPRRTHNMRQRIAHPLTVICAIQVALSLSLVWSNTAYIDEADYLWVGRLEIAHWLHGSSWPSTYADRLFSGTPIIYPPIGALADSIGGLAGARIVSLCFMLGTTVLLYLTALRLIGRRGAIISAALWALSEPAIRLTFATFDPLSVFLTAVSVWLIVQAGRRRHRVIFVLAAALALAAANVTAYSGIVIDPVVIAFAFLAWLPDMQVRRAALYTIWLTGASVLLFALLIIASHSWSGLQFTVIARNIADHEDTVTILSDCWAYAGMLLVLATIGSITACSTERRSRAGLLLLLGFAAFIVPAAQIHDQTAWSLDKHLAYGVWFGAIAAGYGCDRLIRRLPGPNRGLIAICSAIAIVYIGVNGWQSAWARYHSWPDAQPFITAFKVAMRQDQGRIYVPGHEANIAEYYSTQGQDWTRWSASMSLDPAALPRNSWSSYYSGQLHTGNYSVIALFYSTTFSSAPDLPGSVLLKPGRTSTNSTLLGLVGTNSGEPGLPSLTRTLEADHQYARVAIGPYDSPHDNGVFVIWQRKAQP